MRGETVVGVSYKVSEMPRGVGEVLLYASLSIVAAIQFGDTLRRPPTFRAITSAFVIGWRNAFNWCYTTCALLGY